MSSSMIFWPFPALVRSPVTNAFASSSSSFLPFVTLIYTFIYFVPMLLMTAGSIVSVIIRLFFSLYSPSECDGENLFLATISSLFLRLFLIITIEEPFGLSYVIIN